MRSEVWRWPSPPTPPCRFAAVAGLPLGLPDLPFHLRLDPLAGFFLLLLGAASAGVSLFSAGYFEKGGGDDIRLVCLQYHVFLAAMLMVLVADDAYLFMVAWESMALASYFLVTTDHRIAEIRSAGFLYLIVAHVGAIAILLTYGVLQLGQWSYTFDAMRANTLAPTCGRPLRFCWPCSDSAPKRAFCPCMSGYRRRTRLRLRRYPAS